MGLIRPKMTPLQYLTPEICEKYNILTTEQKAMFLAQANYESAAFTKLEENLNYSTPERLMEIFPSYISNRNDALRYLMNPRMLANFVYANRLGNCMPNDGYNFRGRGVFQLTGRSNYNLLRLAERVDCINNPDLLMDENKWALISGLWYWDNQKLYTYPEIEAVTHLLTGNKNNETNGLADRTKLYYAYLEKINEANK